VNNRYGNVVDAPIAGTIHFRKPAQQGRLSRVARARVGTSRREPHA